MRRHLNYFFLLSLFAVFFGFLYWGWCYLKRPSTLPFHRVRLIYPAEHIDAKQISQLTWNTLEGGFFSLNVDKLKAALLQQPWIISVSIRREWPDTLALSIQERHPEARWGARDVISSDGEIFSPPPDSIPEGLPTLVAPKAQSKKILSNFQKLSDDLQLLNLRIDTLTVSDRGVYQMLLSNGIPVMLGRDNVLNRFRRFVDLYPKVIAGKTQQVASVDLRYTNGFAVKWKSKGLLRK